MDYQMKTSVAIVEYILRKELLVPVKRLRLDQALATSAELSSFEWNVLLYYPKEKYDVQLNSISSTATVQDILTHVQPNQE
jgi:hypothetical protein